MAVAITAVVGRRSSVVACGVVTTICAAGPPRLSRSSQPRARPVMRVRIMRAMPVGGRSWLFIWSIA
jgi:hypothetical protein